MFTLILLKPVKLPSLESLVIERAARNPVQALKQGDYMRENMLAWLVAW